MNLDKILFAHIREYPHYISIGRGVDKSDTKAIEADFRSNTGVLALDMRDTLIGYALRR